MNPKRMMILRTVLDFLTTPAAASKRLTLANIAQALDMGKSTVYEYFETKDKMIQEAILLMMDDHMVMLLAGEDFPRQSFDEAFQTYMERSFMIAEKNQMVQQVIESIDVISLDVNMKKELMASMVAFYEQSRQRMQAILQKGVNEGILQPVTQPLQMATIESMFLGALLSWTSPLNDWDKVGLTSALKDSLIRLHRP